MNRFKPFFLNLILVWLTIIFYKIGIFYVNFLRQETQTTLFLLALTYTIIGGIYYIYNPTKESKGTITLSILKKLITRLSNSFLPISRKKYPEKITEHEKITFLFILVKIFFLPIMLNFFISNLYIVKNQFFNLPTISTLLTINTFNILIFPILISLIFLIDTLYFSFGYATESKFLDNKIRSVEPTILGWFVTLICYPPFNSIITKHLRWYSDIYIIFPNTILTFAIKLGIVALLLIYLSATIALGTKCSNLTNRGIVSKGIYSIIRHPAYISKNLAWWLILLPIMSWPAFISLSIWSFIYHLRTITEERHLRQDPDYMDYCRKVKYRYIPYIY